MMDLDGLVVGSELASDHETKHKWYGSGFLMKQERSGSNNSTAGPQDDGDGDGGVRVHGHDYWRSNKVAKTDDKSILFHQRNSLLRSNSNAATLFSDTHHQQQMLSFSSPKSASAETNFLVDKTSPNPAFVYPYLHLSSCNRTNTGYSSGSMHGVVAGTRGLFTPSQWMELEHQALIYKYITANVPVPSHLLIPIKKALDSAAFCNFSAAFLRPNALGWGGFHLGFSNSTDPEPGRCRRTDGKKWRCSRDAVVDQKYCERHMNRGRHRSRKPVEGQSGHALTGTTTTTTTTTAATTATTNANNAAAASKLIMMPNNNVVAPGGTASNVLAFAQQDQPNKNMHTLASDTSASNTINRMFMSNKESGSERVPNSDSLPMLPPTLNLKPKENSNNPFLIHRQQHILYEESSRNEFGFVTSDSLLNPSQKNSTNLVSRDLGSSQNQENDSQHSLRHFMDDWPKLEERTELSISIPMTASMDFMSSTSSPTNDKVNLSPLRLSRELDPIQMGLGVGIALNDSNNTRRQQQQQHQQGNWIPIPWENSMGGPLGEVLNVSNNNASSDCANNSHNTSSSSALNLMTDGWGNSPPLGASSPTGVLQKTAFGSLSTSSAGSSPRAENNNCNDLLSSTLANSSL